MACWRTCWSCQSSARWSCPAVSLRRCWRRLAWQARRCGSSGWEPNGCCGSRWIAGLDGAVFLLPAAPWTVLPLAGAGAMLLLLAPVQQLLASRRLTLVRRGVGAGLMALAVLVWARAERPMILVAAEGDAVGILTDAGRVPSSPRGGSFAVGQLA